MAPYAARKPAKKFPPRFWTKVHCSQCARFFPIRERGAVRLQTGISEEVWKCGKCCSGQLELPGVFKR